MSSAPSSFKLSSMLKRIGHGTPESQSERGQTTDPHQVRVALASFLSASLSYLSSCSTEQRDLGSSGSGMVIDIDTPKFEDLANSGGIGEHPTSTSRNRPPAVKLSPFTLGAERLPV